VTKKVSWSSNSQWTNLKLKRQSYVLTLDCLESKNDFKKWSSTNTPTTLVCYINIWIVEMCSYRVFKMLHNTCTHKSFKTWKICTWSYFTAQLYTQCCNNDSADKLVCFVLLLTGQKGNLLLVSSSVITDHNATRYLWWAKVTCLYDTQVNSQ
jgi:hypothetical protein